MTKNILILILLAVVTAEVDYGYFSTKVNFIKTCQGPKRNNCCKSSVIIKGENMVSYNINCQEKVNPTKGKIVASMKDHQKLRLQMNKPCSHVFIKPFFEQIFNATKDCTISKGLYNFNFDYADVFQKYYSGMFFYGNWTFENMFFNENCNFLCVIADINFYPKAK